MRRCLRILFYVTTMLNCPASLHAQGFSIEQALSAPYNSELIAAPKGGWLVWQANQQGHRNLWIAKPAGSGFAARSLTHYDADDGVELGDVTWTPDGGQVVYVRGGDFEAPEKPAPNPAMLLTPVEQDIWIVPAAGGEPRQVAEGRSPSISPDGRTLAYLFKDQVWTISLPAAKPAQLFHGRGKVSGLRWSGDGKYLAFVSHRDDHSFVGVYNFPTHTPSYLDPATTFDSEPAWAPDSRSLAFLRVPPGLTGYEFRPNRIAQPWSILVADPATGKTRTIWQARPGQGSAFREIVARDQLLWSADGRIVFPWEADGWLHLYSVAAAGGKAQLLTPGAFEVEQVALSPDHRAVVYSSNQDDIDRRHIWSVAPEGGAPKQLTGGTGIEVSPAISGEGKTVAILRSNARMPMRPAIVYPGGEIRDLAPQLIPHDFPGEQLTDPQQVVFSAADGLQLHAQLFLPHASAEGIKHPAVVFFHGGSRRQMLLGWHYMEYYSNAYAMNQYLASLGYIVLSVNYRSGIGYGLDFREAIDYGAAGASEFNDVLGAGLYLRARPDVDGTRIGAWGGSYGGYLTALALARASDLFAAGVDMHGVHDWNIELGNWQAYDANADPAAARIAFESSPLASVKTWRSPVLLIQGDDDRNVQFSQMVRMAAALRAQGVPFEEHVFPDEIHDFLLHQSWLTAYKLEATFLDKYLKPANK